MLIMRPMRSRGNEVMCVCVVPSVTMSLAVVYAKRTSWCLLGLLPSQLSTTLREHGENLCISSLGSTRLDCIAPTKTRNAFLNRRAVFKIVYAPVVSIKHDRLLTILHRHMFPYFCCCLFILFLGGGGGFL